MEVDVCVCVCVGGGGWMDDGEMIDQMDSPKRKRS